MSGQNLVLSLFVGFVVVLSVVRALRRVKPEEARTLVAKGARLLDVRSAGEFGAGHLPGAVNVPLSELSSRLSEVGPKDRPIVVYCRSGARSASAAGILRKAGFSSVHDLGPISRW